MTAAQSAALADLHVRVMGPEDGFSADGLTRLLAASAARGWVEEQAAGFILAFAAADEAEVLALIVAPEHRRQGLGRALLRKLERGLSAEGVRHLYLEVRASNLAARELYIRHGFGETGRRKGYYRSGGDSGIGPEDAITMAKALTPGAA